MRNFFDPRGPLKPDELQDWFVPRPNSPIGRLRALLEEPAPDHPQKVLFTVHWGSGKSTELVKLASEIGDRYFVVPFSVLDITDIGDLDYVDVVVGMAAEVFRQATEHDVPVNKELLEDVYRFFAEEITEKTVEIERTGDIGLDLKIFVVKMEGKIKRESASRQVFRERARRRLSDLVEKLDLLVTEVQQHDGRPVLIVIEDLDKPDLAKAKELFYGHGSSLTAPHCNIIYTFPVALRYDNDFPVIRQGFSTFTLPNFSARLRGGAEDTAGGRQLRQLVLSRAEERLFGEGALNRLAEQSGGLPRQMALLVREASLYALAAGQKQISLQAVVSAALDEQKNYQVLLTPAQLALLAEVHRTKKVVNDQAHRELLHNLSILEYDTEVWYDVNPVIWPLLPPEGAP
jgi:hypothetical protein